MEVSWTVRVFIRLSLIFFKLDVLYFVVKCGDRVWVRKVFNLRVVKMIRLCDIRYLCNELKNLC